MQGYQKSAGDAKKCRTSENAQVIIHLSCNSLILIVFFKEKRPHLCDLSTLTVKNHQLALERFYAPVEG